MNHTVTVVLIKLTFPGLGTEDGLGQITDNTQPTWISKKTESVSQIGDMCREVLQIANHIHATTSNAASDYDTISPTQPLSGEPGQAPPR
jgi:hypothetical protein